MAKKAQHNLNKMKGTKILLLILALSFVVVPLISLIVSIINLRDMPFFYIQMKQGLILLALVITR